MPRIIFMMAVVCIVACQQPAEQPSMPADLTPIPSVGDQKCYSLTSEDTVFLKLSGPDSAITGTLTYRLKEKDANKGTITGSWRGDTLVAVYTFNSEGSSSRRPVIFLRDGKQLTEGYGPVSAREFSLITPELTFRSGIRLTETECSQVKD